MESLLKHDQLNFEILDHNANTVQVILLPNQTIYTDINYVIYSSANLSFREFPVSCWKKFFVNPIGPQYRVKNRKGGVEYLGLSKSSGRIVGMNPHILEDPFILDKNLILAYTSGIKLSIIPEANILMKKTQWREARGSGIVFLQGYGSIIEKRLGAEEEININKNDILAYSKSIKISESSIHRSYKAFFINDWCLMKVKGPGWVFIDGSARNKSSHVHPRRRSDLWQIFLIFALIFLLAFIEVVLQI